MDKKAVAVGLLTLSLIPIWRSGGRGRLNFWAWLINHTIWGPPVEYVPEEDYMSELAGIVQLEPEPKPITCTLTRL